jgi:hypothetical protein
MVNISSPVPLVDANVTETIPAQIAALPPNVSNAVLETVGTADTPMPLRDVPLAPPLPENPLSEHGAPRPIEVPNVVLSAQGIVTGTGETVPTPDSIPRQYLAPVHVEERNGKVALAHQTDGNLLAAERDFDDWRDPIIEHIQELSSNDFRQGTNHSRVRDRLVSLGNLLPGSIAQVKERQFRIGYEVERLGALISAYRSGGEDMPVVNAAVLEDLDQLHLALRMGINKFQRWVEFCRQAADDPEHEGDADPTMVADALENMAAAMEAQPKYFTPELPASFRFIVEAVRDRPGASKAIVYGAVKSAENLISFLAKKALGIAKNAIEGLEQYISKAIAGPLIVALGGGALMLSGALPQGWAWLKPLLEYLARTP